MVSFVCKCDVSSNIVGEIKCDGLNGVEWSIDADCWNGTDSVIIADLVGRFESEFFIDIGKHLVAEKATEFKVSVVISERQVGAIAGNRAVIREHESLAKAPAPASVAE
jgi:hypothetical protein